MISNQLNGHHANGSTPRISIQGCQGSFHQLAAQRYFGKDVQVIECESFREVIKIASLKEQSDGGIMAIENSIAGSILANYNLLRKSNLMVAGELTLKIEQHLMVNPGVTIDDIHEVHSHPMALQQCLKFLDKYNWKLVEAEDTASSAKSVHQHKSKHIAAIAGRLAAEIYQLEIIAPGIHTLKNNYTRFLILQPKDSEINIEGANKASITFFTDNSRGSLAKVLTKIAECGVALIKLQSFPIANVDFEYGFHADIGFESIQEFHEVMEAIKPLTEEVIVFGIYKKGMICDL
ncbi:MAG TPA: prephenate dehydratase [Panacibacter sp.]|nr:prephenate dehydratase [Panacibacter sp.]